MKIKKLVLHRETVHRLDPEDLRLAAAGLAPHVSTRIPPAGLGSNTQPVPFRTTQDLSWCIPCASVAGNAC